MSKTIYLFGEAHSGTFRSEIDSNDPGERAEAIGETLRKISKLRGIVDEKQVRKIFVEEGSGLEKPIILGFPDVIVEVLHADPSVQRIIDVTRREMADSISLKEKLLSEFASIDEKSPKSYGSDEARAERERYVLVLQERMSGLKPVDELFHKLDEATATLELGWVDQIHIGFIDPSLLFCGKGHIYPDKEDVMDFGKSGRIPDLLQEKGYNVEVVFVESDVY